jgi:hypothetical protein
MERRRQSLRWRMRHANPRGLTSEQYIAAEAAQRQAIVDAEHSHEGPWPHEAMRRPRPFVPSLTPDQAAAALNHQLVIEANRRG